LSAGGTEDEAPKVEEETAGRKEIDRLYGKYDPAKLEKVDGLVEKYTEAGLLKMVRKKYAADEAEAVAAEAKEGDDQSATAKQGDQSATATGEKVGQMVSVDTDDGIGELGWEVGQVVSIDTEDGLENGVVILGPAESGSQTELRVKFADGTIDDWEIDDFVRPVKEEEPEPEPEPEPTVEPTEPGPEGDETDDDAEAFFATTDEEEPEAKEEKVSSQAVYRVVVVHFDKLLVVTGCGEAGWRSGAGSRPGRDDHPQR